MPTKSWTEIERHMTPEAIAKSDAKSEQLRVGCFISQQRQKLGLTQMQLAEKMDVSQPVISQVEWGEEIEFSILRRVIAALGGEVFFKMPDETVSLNALLHVTGGLEDASSSVSPLACK